MKGNRIIVHALIKVDDKYLLTKRSEKENYAPYYWDLPGGMVELGELPIDGLHREVMEEVNLIIKPLKIIHEDSNYDKEKDMVFVRLVYLCELDDDLNNIKIDLEEHSEYKLISNLNDLKDELIIDFIYDIFECK